MERCRISSALPPAPALRRRLDLREEQQRSARHGAAGPEIRVDAGGTRLRIRALAAMGHGAARIARAAGTSEQAIQRLSRGTARTVSLTLRDAVACVYEAWWDKRPPENTRQQKAAAAAARRRAARGNWCPGAGLDDDLLDQPGYRPESGWKASRGTGVAADSGGLVTRMKGTDMGCDRRHTAALVADVLTVLHQHGYRPGDPVHAQRAVRLIGDLARIYQGTQDAPAGAYIIQLPPGTALRHRRCCLRPTGKGSRADKPLGCDDGAAR